jgi:hypothetical protein
MKQPTPEQCTNREAVTSPHGRPGFAAWYPQIGGYVAPCIVEVNSEGCFEVWLWHDGEFPTEDDVQPMHFHHCDPEQFIRFGQLVLSRTPAREK